MTDKTLRIVRIHKALQEQSQNGLLGVIAARTRISEGALFNFVHDMRGNCYLTETELKALERVLLHPQVTVQLELIEGGARDSGYNPYDTASLPAFVRPQAS